MLHSTELSLPDTEFKPDSSNGLPVQLRARVEGA
jgi:hypothetical protein